MDDFKAITSLLPEHIIADEITSNLTLEELYYARRRFYNRYIERINDLIKSVDGTTEILRLALHTRDDNLMHKFMDGILAYSPIREQSWLSLYRRYDHNVLLDATLSRAVGIFIDEGDRVAVAAMMSLGTTSQFDQYNTWFANRKIIGFDLLTGSRLGALTLSDELVVDAVSNDNPWVYGYSLAVILGGVGNGHVDLIVKAIRRIYANNDERVPQQLLDYLQGSGLIDYPPASSEELMNMLVAIHLASYLP